LNVPGVKEMIEAEGKNSELKQGIHKAFEDYQKQVENITKNANATDKASQAKLTKRLEEAQRKLKENIDLQISKAQERATLNSPAVKSLIKAEGRDSQLKKDIAKAYKDSRAKQQALAKQYSGTDKDSQAKLQKALEDEQRQLGIIIQTAILKASLRAFKNDPNMQAMIEMDKTFGKALDVLFQKHIEKMTSVLKDTTTTPEEKAQKLQALQTDFSVDIFGLQLDSKERITVTTSPEYITLVAAYPSLEQEYHALYANYKEQRAALFKQPLPPQELQKQEQQKERDFLQAERDVFQKYYLAGMQDSQFWKKVADNVNEQQWNDLAAMRQGQNLLRLMQMVPDLANNEDKSKSKDVMGPLDVIEGQLTKFMDIQNKLYTDYKKGSISNMDIVMRALMLQEEQFIGNVLYLCGDKQKMEKYSNDGFEVEKAEEEEKAEEMGMPSDAEIDQIMNQYLQQK